jgi:signal peptidase II
MPGSETERQSKAVRAYRCPQAWVIFLSILLFGFALDLSTKYWTFANVADRPVVLDRERLLTEPHHHPIPPHDGISILPGRLLNLQLVINHGAVFGLGDGMRYFFIAFTLVALGAGIFIFGRYCTSRTYLATIGLALILAGGAGNLYDRIIYGVVRDFLHMLPGRHLPFGWRWPHWFGGSPELFPWVFNIADVMLLTGMAMVLLHMHRIEQRRKRATDYSKQGGEDGATTN